MCTESLELIAIAVPPSAEPFRISATSTVDHEDTEPQVKAHVAYFTDPSFSTPSEV